MVGSGDGLGVGLGGRVVWCRGWVGRCVLGCWSGVGLGVGWLGSF